MKTQKELTALEPRKLAEIEHSRRRRSILQGFERRSDTHKDQEVPNLDLLILDKEAFNYHFSNIKFYSVAQSSEAYQYFWLARKCRHGVKVLDFACGNGENAIFAAKCGAETIGIDISPDGVANANLNALQAGVSDHCSFEVMDGEKMSFADNTFDIGVEYGALHHVDLERAMAELNRVIKPQGEMICVEALRHNPFIHWYRKGTPHLRTKWEVEHILSLEDLRVVREYFSDIEVRFFHLAVLAAVPFRKTRIFNPLRKFLDRIDNFLLKKEFIGKYSWIMIFSMSNAAKSS
jgi:ubiquinone/menaquinone biosynthesis C-methylase UbiE